MNSLFTSIYAPLKVFICMHECNFVLAIIAAYVSIAGENAFLRRDFDLERGKNNRGFEEAY